VPDHLLPSPPGFDPATQAVVATWAAGLDDQLRRLEAAIGGLPVAAFEWQSAPGMNSIGMLVAHLALVEVWWIRLAPTTTGPFSDMDGRFREILGIGGDDDGITDRGSSFPAALRGKRAEEYVALLRTARASAGEALRAWTDADLERTVAGRRGTVSWRWILYHVLEHFAGHFGQVLLIKHQLRDAGLLPET
jgi:uncharacterized damage-inducible protein DinB